MHQNVLDLDSQQQVLAKRKTLKKRQKKLYPGSTLRWIGGVLHYWQEQTIFFKDGQKKGWLPLENVPAIPKPDSYALGLEHQEVNFKNQQAENKENQELSRYRRL